MICTEFSKKGYRISLSLSLSLYIYIYKDSFPASGVKNMITTRYKQQRLARYGTLANLYDHQEWGHS